MSMPLNNPAVATNAALATAKAPQPAPQRVQPQQVPAQAAPKPVGVRPNDKFSQVQAQGSDPDIMKNLEQHLNQLPDKQKMFLTSSLQHYGNIVIPVLGIVCGQEVFQYFLNIYKQSFANQGAQGQQSPQQPAQPQQPPQPNSAQQNSSPSPQPQVPAQQAQAPQ